MHRSRSVRRVEVTTDGTNLVSHAGTALLCELADRTGSDEGHVGGDGRLRHLLAHPRPGRRAHPSRRRHRRWGGLPHRLRSAPVEQSELFGEVASVSTAWRAVKATASLELRQIPRAVAAAREVVWAAAPPGDITIDFDATLLDVHSEKQDAASDLQARLWLSSPRRLVRHDRRAARGDAASGQRRLERRRRPPRAVGPGDRLPSLPSTR